MESVKDMAMSSLTKKPVLKNVSLNLMGKTSMEKILLYLSIQRKIREKILLIISLIFL